MAAAFQQAIWSNRVHGYCDGFDSYEGLRNYSLRLTSNSYGISMTSLRKAHWRCNHLKMFVVHSLVPDPVLSSLQSSTDYSWKIGSK